MNQEVKMINGYSVKDEKAIRTYDTVALMKADRKLKQGQHVKTRGYYSINDGGSAEYYITSNQSESEYQENLENGLYASLLDNFESNFYDEITYTQERYYDTDCYFTNIPLYDENNEIIDLYVAHREYQNQSPLLYAQDNLTTLTINASLSIKNTEDDTKSGIPTIIANGEIIRDNSMYNEGGIADNYLYIGITENREIKEFRVNNTTNNQLIDSGCKNVFNCYYKLIENFSPVDLTNVVTNEPNVVTDPHPRQVLCEMENKSIMILTCDGRTGESIGLTSQQLQSILIDKNVKNAWNLDGGGSSSTEVKTIKINRNIDSSFTKDRIIPYTLNVKKITKNKNVGKIYSELSKTIHFLNKRYQNERIRMHDISGKNANEIIGELYFGFGARLSNTPNTIGYLMNLTDTLLPENRYLYNKQVFFDFENYKIFIREMNNGIWSEWLNSSNPLSRLVINNFTLNESDTYIEIPLNENINYDGNSLILNEDNTFSFNDYSNKLLYLECRIKGSSGAKFLKLMRGTDDIIFQSTYNADNNAHQLILIAPILMTNRNNKFKLYVQGQQNDVVENIRCYIK